MHRRIFVSDFCAIWKLRKACHDSGLINGRWNGGIEKVESRKGSSAPA